jgi:NAD(P)-dependent dehydrogenase (short-subunit alcohol dehydrogenase family)
VNGRFGRVDVVLHLVGGYRGGGRIADIAAADWQELHGQLVVTTLNVVRAFAAPLAAGGRGRFIAVTSPKARAPTARSAVYSMAKAASEALVLALADEMKGTGATANLLEVDSIGKAPAPDAAGRKTGPRPTDPADIAAAMLWLCSPGAAGVNGARVPLAGRG